MALLDEVAELMKHAARIDPQAIVHLYQLQARLRQTGDDVALRALPSKPPALWAERPDRSEGPVDFIKRVYGDWLGAGLTRPHIRQYDSKLYMALYKYLAEGGRLPPDFDLPTKKQANDRHLERLGLDSSDPSVGMQEALRLYQAARRRALSSR